MAQFLNCDPSKVGRIKDFPLLKIPYNPLIPTHGLMAPKIYEKMYYDKPLTRNVIAKVNFRTDSSRTGVQKDNTCSFQCRLYIASESYLERLVGENQVIRNASGYNKRLEEATLAEEDRENALIDNLRVREYALKKNAELEREYKRDMARYKKSLLRAQAAKGQESELQEGEGELQEGEYQEEALQEGEAQEAPVKGKGKKGKKGKAAKLEDLLGSDEALPEPKEPDWEEVPELLVLPEVEFPDEPEDLEVNQFKLLNFAETPISYNTGSGAKNGIYNIKLKFSHILALIQVVCVAMELCIEEGEPAFLHPQRIQLFYEPLRKGYSDNQLAFCIVVGWKLSNAIKSRCDNALLRYHVSLMCSALDIGYMYANYHNAELPLGQWDTALVTNKPALDLKYEDYKIELRDVDKTIPAIALYIKNAKRRAALHSNSNIKGKITVRKPMKIGDYYDD